MYIPKRYGQSKITRCVFCSKQAISKNKQGLPACNNHRNEILDEIKCLCGSWLEIRDGKYGAFFLCRNCGPINLMKGLDIADAQQRYETERKILKSEKKETTITSNDVEYFD